MKKQCIQLLVLIIFSALAFSAQAQAQAPISGAFGYALGAKYEGDLSGYSVNEDGFFEVEFTPASGPKDFEIYLLSVAPDDGRIAQLVAARTFADNSDAEVFLFARKKELEQTYGASRIEEGAMVIERGAKSVALSLDEEGESLVVAVVYQDDDLTARVLLGQDPGAGAN
jgi:hypothetical protein